MNKPYIVAIVESHLNKDIEAAEIKMDNYELFRSDRKDRSHGGVLLYVRQDIPAVQTLSFSNSVCEALAVKVKVLDLMIAILYRPPACGLRDFDEMIQEVKNVFEEEDTPNKLLAGDLNFPWLDWKLNDGRNEATLTSKAQDKIQSNILLDAMEELYLSNYSREPTRAQNVLDLVMSNNPDMVIDLKVTASAHLSDHHQLEFEIFHQYKLPKMLKKSEKPYLMETYKFEIEGAKPEDWERYKQLMFAAEEEWNVLSPKKELEAKLEMFYKIMERIVKQVFQLKPEYSSERPSSRMTNNKIPKKARILMKQRRRIADKIRASSSWQKSMKLLGELEEKEKLLSTHYKERKMVLESAAIQKIKRDPKYFFNYANKFAKSKGAKIGALFDEEGKLCVSTRQKCEVFRKQFQSFFSEPAPGFPTADVDAFCGTNSNEPDPCVAQPTDVPLEVNLAAAEHVELEVGPGLGYIVFTPDEVGEAISQLNISSSPGPDGVVPKLLKGAKGSIARMTSAMFQQSMETGEVPQGWKEGFISPVHKGGSSTEASNFRPVCLTSHVVKTNERVIKTKMVAYLEALNKMDENQHGARGGRSTLSQLLIHHYEICKLLEEGSNVDVVYCDMAKAYQKVDHGILLYKIRSLGFRGRLLRWIVNFLKNRTQRVIIDGELSEETEVQSSVPEGSCLGPLFFLIHMSDIGVGISSTIRIFVDDSKISKAIRGEEDVEQLQEDLDTLFSWAKQNNMQFNGKKFQLLRYGKNEDVKNNTMYFTEDTSDLVERTEVVRDLGVMLSDDAKFKNHIDKVVAKSRQKSGWIMRTFVNRSPHLMRTLLKTLVLPHVDYCSQLWSPSKGSDLLKLEKIQKDFFNKIPSIRSLSYWDQLASMKMLSVQRRLERYKIIYVWKVAESLVPACGISVSHGAETRLGRRVVAEFTGRGSSSLLDQVFQRVGPKLFNSVPAQIRNLSGCGVAAFKSQLDEYLAELYDEPQLPGLTPRGIDEQGAASNSVIYQKRKEAGDCENGRFPQLRKRTPG